MEATESVTLQCLEVKIYYVIKLQAFVNLQSYIKRNPKILIQHFFPALFMAIVNSMSIIYIK